MGNYTQKDMQWASIARMFLKSEGAYNKFVKNYKGEVDFTDVVDGDGITFAISNGVDDFLGGCFVWCDTKEGHNYWSNLDKKWEEFYKSMEGFSYR